MTPRCGGLRRGLLPPAKSSVSPRHASDAMSPPSIKCPVNAAWIKKVSNMLHETRRTIVERPPTSCLTEVVTGGSYEAVPDRCVVRDACAGREKERGGLNTRPSEKTLISTASVLSCPLLYSVSRLGLEPRTYGLSESDRGRTCTPHADVVLCQLSYTLKSVALPTELPALSTHPIKRPLIRPVVPRGVRNS
jgi:hypothetical protein